MRRPSWRTSVPVMATKSAYFGALNNESEKRYLEKIKEVCEIDPFSLKKNNLSAKYEDFLSDDYLVCYLLQAPRLKQI